MYTVNYEAVLKISYCTFTRYTNLHNNVANGLLSRLREDRFLRSARSLYDRGKVEADSTIQEAPEETWQEVEQGLADEYQRHPLVV